VSVERTNKKKHKNKNLKRAIKNIWRTFMMRRGMADKNAKKKMKKKLMPFSVVRI
jgi:hypothetical protein